MGADRTNGPAGPKGEFDWIFPAMSKDGTSWTMDATWNAGLHLMGSRTYHNIVADCLDENRNVLT